MTNLSSTRRHYAIDDIYTFSLEVLQKAGYSLPKAEATATALLEADKRGIFSHGTAGGTGIEESVKRAGLTATVKLDTEPVIEEQRYPTLAVINANGAPGHYTSEMAVKLVKKIARQYGYGKVIVNNANHYGAAGVWSHRIASDGDLKGISTCTTAAVAKVMGDDINRLDYTKGAGTERRMGTNPLAISFPHTDGVLTFDTAWVRMAVSYCLKFLKSGQMLTVPEYVADENYQSSLDPTDFANSMETLSEEKGSIFPHGSTLAGYKGDAMLRFIEIDNAVGGGPIQKIPIGASDDSRRISHTFEAQALDMLYPLDEVKNRIRELMTDYEQNYFGSNSRWPGERGQQALAYAMEHGIPYSDSQVATLRRAAEHVDHEFGLEPIQDTTYPADIFNK